MPTMKVKVSVVMGVYNGADTLEATIKSILNQSFRDFELIIVNDGSDANTTNLLNHLNLQDSRITVLSKKRNEGLTKALITGCQVARGDYVARIDNGDLMVPRQRLYLQSKALDSDTELVLVGGGMDVVDLVNKDVYRSRNFPLNDKDIRTRIMTDSIFAHMTVMFRRAAYQECGGYNPACYTGQDSELWPRMLEIGKGVILNEIFAIATMRPDSISVKQNNRQIWAAIGREWAGVCKREISLKKIKRIALYLIKLLIPIKLRVRLRYRKNFKYIEKYTGDGESLEAILDWHQIRNKYW